MIAKVPTIDIGSARLGMRVAETLRRNRKITSTTRTSVRSSVNCTSLTEFWIETERSYRTCRETDAGNSLRKLGRRRCTAPATATVLVPGWRWIARMIERSSRSRSQNQAAVLSFSTLSITRPSSCSRTGEPLR